MALLHRFLPTKQLEEVVYVKHTHVRGFSVEATNEDTSVVRRSQKEKWYRLRLAEGTMGAGDVPMMVRLLARSRSKADAVSDIADLLLASNAFGSELDPKEIGAAIPSDYVESVTARILNGATPGSHADVAVEALAHAAAATGWVQALKLMSLLSDKSELSSAVGGLLLQGTEQPPENVCFQMLCQLVQHPPRRTADLKCLPDIAVRAGDPLLTLECCDVVGERSSSHDAVFSVKAPLLGRLGLWQEALRQTNVIPFHQRCIREHSSIVEALLLANSVVSASLYVQQFEHKPLVSDRILLELVRRLGEPSTEMEARFFFAERVEHIVTVAMSGLESRSPEANFLSQRALAASGRWDVALAGLRWEKEPAACSELLIASARGGIPWGVVKTLMHSLRTRYSNVWTTQRMTSVLHQCSLEVGNWSDAILIFQAAQNTERQLDWNSLNHATLLRQINGSVKNIPQPLNKVFSPSTFVDAGRWDLVLRQLQYDQWSALPEATRRPIVAVFAVNPVMWRQALHLSEKDDRERRLKVILQVCASLCKVDQWEVALREVAPHALSEGTAAVCSAQLVWLLCIALADASYHREALTVMKASREDPVAAAKSLHAVRPSMHTTTTLAEDCIQRRDLRQLDELCRFNNHGPSPMPLTLLRAARLLSPVFQEQIALEQEDSLLCFLDVRTQSVLGRHGKRLVDGTIPLRRSNGVRLVFNVKTSLPCGISEVQEHDTPKIVAPAQLDPLLIKLREQLLSRPTDRKPVKAIASLLGHLSEHGFSGLKPLILAVRSMEVKQEALFSLLSASVGTKNWQLSLGVLDTIISQGFSPPLDTLSLLLKAQESDFLQGSNIAPFISLVISFQRLVGAQQALKLVSRRVSRSLENVSSMHWSEALRFLQSFSLMGLHELPQSMVQRILTVPNLEVLHALLKVLSRHQGSASGCILPMSIDNIEMLLASCSNLGLSSQFDIVFCSSRRNAVVASSRITSSQVSARRVCKKLLNEPLGHWSTALSLLSPKTTFRNHDPILDKVVAVACNRASLDGVLKVLRVVSSRYTDALGSMESKELILPSPPHVDRGQLGLGTIAVVVKELLDRDHWQTALAIVQTSKAIHRLDSKSPFVRHRRDIRSDVFALLMVLCMSRSEHYEDAVGLTMASHGNQLSDAARLVGLHNDYLQTKNRTPSLLFDDVVVEPMDRRYTSDFGRKRHVPRTVKCR